MVKEKIEIVAEMIDNVTGVSKRVERSVKKLSKSITTTARTFEMASNGQERLIKTTTTVKDTTARYRAQQEKQNAVQQKAVQRANVLANKNKFLRNEARRLGITTDQVQKSMAAVDLEFNKQGKVIGKAGQKIRVTNKLMERGRTISRGFQFGWLSVMFAGMALNRVFGGLLKSQLQLFGITELFSAVLTVVMLPVMMLLLPLFLKLAEVFMDLPDSVKLAIGVIILLGFFIGLLLLIVGQVMLAWGGFALLISGAAPGMVAAMGTVALAFLALLLILVGISIIVAGVVIIVQNWGEDWTKVLSGIGISLIGLGTVFIGVMIAMAAAGVASGILVTLAWAGVIIILVGIFILFVAFVIRNWEEIKDQFTILWASVGVFFGTVINGMITIFEKFINRIIDQINLVIAASNAFFGTSFTPIPNLDLSKFKAQLTDMEALRARLDQDRKNRELAASLAAEEGEAGGFLSNLIPDVSNLIPEQPQGVLPVAPTAGSTQEINISNTNTFNVLDKEEMQKMIDENMSKQVEEIKRFLTP